MSTPLAPTPVQPGAEILDRILANRGCLIALEDVDSETLIAQLRQLVRRSGQAVYLWHPSAGLGNLREEHAVMAGSQRLGLVLRYIQQSNHFGVYFLKDVPTPMAGPDAALVRQLARTATGHIRRIVLLDAPSNLVDGFNDVIVRMSCQVKAAQRPRLRDGRWLL
ncbi:MULTISPECIES: hypothetical protein [Dyella]|uniref:Uncharacterized protein n=2 Tax=Dyella TaxID=231454 RepID=A0A4R0Z078_9GAMM|nr:MULTISPECIES: hypothetical protein [Dyella]TBR39670.1 hypothetical protein EYV96_05575 [Dyella terrae]TCI12748.1 hypothetical protein EZM97_05295 [Dyella soli]